MAAEPESGGGVSVFRQKPYVVFFPAGIAIALAAVGHWFFHAVGWSQQYRPIFHSIGQVQGFLTCFATGFLFTMVPRRTMSAPPAGWQVLVGVALPLLAAAAAWRRSWVLSQVAWLAAAAIVAGFVARRFVGRRSARRPPVAFVWIPMSLLIGVAGSVATLVPAAGLGPAWLHQLGRGLVLQGMFSGLVVGVGSLALPLMTRGEGPPDATRAPRDLVAIGAHAAGAALLVGSFLVEMMLDLRTGLLLRGGVVLIVLLASVRLWRPVRRPGWNARLIWLSAWLVPAGYLLAALFPTRYLACLHVTFIGGFALLALAVSMQVTLGHGGRQDLQLGRPWQVPAIAALVLAAAAARAMMDIDFRRRSLWMATASALFVAASLIWLLLLAPSWRR